MINRLRETTLFTISINCITYLGVTQTKQVQDLYNKKFKSLKREILEDTRRWNMSHTHISVGLT